MGRPSKFDRNKMDMICKAMEVGATRSLAAQAAGVHVATLYAWLAKGREAEDGDFREFHDRIKKSEAMCALRDLSIVTAASQNDWRASAWRLERRFGYQIGAPPKEEHALDAVELDVPTLLKQLAETEEMVRTFSGPVIDVNEV